MSKNLTVSKVLFVATFVLYVLSAVMLYNGYDKKNNYCYNEYYDDLNKNAYVGGDAYNYIINGNYATGFYVLSIGFMITGTMLLGTGLIINHIPEASILDKKVVKKETQKDIAEELPEL